jgi:hypothetical protein
MKLIGYIKAMKENCFAIPIYSDGNSNFFHDLNDLFEITNFTKTEIDNNFFVKTYLSKKFKKKSIGAIIFVGIDNFVIKDSANEIINELFFYLNDTTKSNEYLNIKKEVLELKFLFQFEKRLKKSRRNPLLKLYGIDKDDKIKVENSLEQYERIENLIVLNSNIFKIKEKIIKKNIENTILNNELFNKNKEVLFSLFKNYLNDNKSVFESIIMDNAIGKDFTHYLSEKSETYNPIELSIEDQLMLITEERRSKLRDFNYQFHHKNYDSYMKEPAYKRLGIDITSMPFTINSNNSSFMILIEDKIISNEIKQLEREKVIK